METYPANAGTPMRTDRIVSQILANPTVQRWFDVGALATPAQYTHGNFGIDILYSPYTNYWDFGLMKDFRLAKVLRESSHVGFKSVFLISPIHQPFALPLATSNRQRPVGF